MDARATRVVVPRWKRERARGRRRDRGEKKERNNLENRGHAIHTRYLQGTTRTMSRWLVRGEGRGATRKRGWATLRARVLNATFFSR